MISPRPLNPILPQLLAGDRRSTVQRPADRGGIFTGWGPKL